MARSVTAVPSSTLVEKGIFSATTTVASSLSKVISCGVEIILKSLFVWEAFIMAAKLLNVIPPMVMGNDTTPAVRPLGRAKPPVSSKTPIAPVLDPPKATPSSAPKGKSVLPAPVQFTPTDTSKETETSMMSAST